VSRNSDINISQQTTLKPVKNPAYLKLYEDEDRPRNSHVLSEDSVGRTSVLSPNFDQTGTA
jgi:hypothetical protein